MYRPQVLRFRFDRPWHLQIPTPLYKYLPRQYADGMVTRGAVRIGTAFDFRRAEQHNEARADIREADASSVTFIDDMTFTAESPPSPHLQRFFGAPQEGQPTRVVESIFEDDTEDTDYWIYSLSERFDVSLLREFECDACIRITNVRGFCAALTRALVSTIRSGTIERCTYGFRYGPYGPAHDRDPIFVKDPRYQHQAEVRLAWEPRQLPVSPVLLEIPALVGCCELVPL